MSFGLTLETKLFSRSEFQIEKTIDGMSKIIKDSKELDLTHRLTFANVSSYVDRDGKTVSNLCADGRPPVDSAHTLRGSGATYSTVISGNPELSQTAIELVEKSFIDTSFDNLGNLVTMEIDILFTTNLPSLVNTASVLLEST
jgi:hypothetical protein